MSRRGFTTTEFDAAAPGPRTRKRRARQKPVTSRGPRRSRRMLSVLIVAGIALVLLVIGALGAAISGLSSHGGHSQHAATTMQQPQQLPTGDALGQTPVSWRSIGRATLPFSDTAGPRTDDGMVASGYTDTPFGASLALLQITSRLSVLPQASTSEILASQVAGDDADRNALSNDITGVQADLGDGDSLPKATAWRLISWDPGAAVVQFAIGNTSDGRYSIGQFGGVFIGGDWKYQPSLGGSAPTNELPPDQISTPNGWNFYKEQQ